MAIARFKVGPFEQEIAYELLFASKCAKNILIIHGWGANKELMSLAFKDQFKGFNKLFVDLPGFGKSSLSGPINSFEYSKIIDFFLNHVEFCPDFMIGHSFGGKIIANLALTREKAGLIFISSAGILQPKSLGIKTKIKLFKTLKCLKLKRIQQMFLADDAKGLDPFLQQTFNLVVNEDYAPIFAKLTNKSLLCWGDKDTATPLKSAEEMSLLIHKSKLKVFLGDHFFFLKQASGIAACVSKYFGV